MRTSIDLQGTQGVSRYRGIGRYSLALAQAMARNRGDHEIIIVLNGMLHDSIEPIRAAFEGLFPQENIRVWYAAEPMPPLTPENTRRRRMAELLRNAFLESLQSDILYITSLFEGYGGDAVHSICGTSIPTTAMFYDLIPLLQSEQYFTPNLLCEAFYRKKLVHLKRANIYLVISESARQECIDNLGAAADEAIDIGVTAEVGSKPIPITERDKRSSRSHSGLECSLMMYSGATDERKNYLRLIKAFPPLLRTLRGSCQLVIAGRLPNDHREKFEKYAELCGLGLDDVVITGSVGDKELVQLYNLCDLFVFPSLHEGFGLPALEIMSCGIPVTGVSISSLPEIIGRRDVLSDPFDEKAISRKMAEVSTNTRLRDELIEHGLKQARNFSWDENAKRAILAFERWYAKQGKTASRNNEALDNDSAIASPVEKITRLNNLSTNDDDRLKTAQATMLNHCRIAKRQLLIDIPELAHHDSKTGTQRVVRSIPTELPTNPPPDFSIEPAYATQYEPGYRYVR